MNLKSLNFCNSNFKFYKQTLELGYGIGSGSEKISGKDYLLSYLSRQNNTVCENKPIEQFATHFIGIRL